MKCAEIAENDLFCTLVQIVLVVILLNVAKVLVQLEIDCEGIMGTVRIPAYVGTPSPSRAKSGDIHAKNCIIPLSPPY